MPRNSTNKLPSILSVVGLGIFLFVKVFLPGDSEGTFAVIESSCHLLLPV